MTYPTEVAGTTAAGSRRSLAKVSLFLGACALILTLALIVQGGRIAA